MSGRVVVNIPRAPSTHVDALSMLGVSTVHEAIGKRGLLGPDLRPIWPGARIAGSAVTVECPPGDNLMVHVAVEQAQPGDVLVLVATEPCTHGYLGELLATSLLTRGVRGLITDTGVRDVAELRELGFPVWSRAVSAQGTSKYRAGRVNVPVVVGGQVVHPGDVVVADDDGVLCVPRADSGQAMEAAEQRIAREMINREKLRNGELGLDMYGLRTVLEGVDIEYVDANASRNFSPWRAFGEDFE